MEQQTCDHVLELKGRQAQWVGNEVLWVLVPALELTSSLRESGPVSHPLVAVESSFASATEVAPASATCL